VERLSPGGGEKRNKVGNHGLAWQFLEDRATLSVSITPLYSLS